LGEQVKKRGPCGQVSMACVVPSRPDPRRRLVLADLEYPASRLESWRTRARRMPSRGSHRRSRYRDRIIQNATGAGGRESPTVGAAICVQPIGNLGLPLSETARRNAHPNADREEALGCGDHLSRVARHPRILDMFYPRMSPALHGVPPAWDVLGGCVMFLPPFL
jgi:hypothetical protein